MENLGTMKNPQISIQEQLNKIIEFRQTIYDQFFTIRQDTQFELLDALIVKGKVPSFPWLSMAGCFQRQWPSVYDAVEAGQQDVVGLREFLTAQVPQAGLQFWSLLCRCRRLVLTRARCTSGSHLARRCSFVTAARM